MLLTVLTILVAAELMSVAAQKQGFTKHDLAYYLDANLASYARPGVAVKITSAQIAPDGTITARFKLTDPKGLPLDMDGVVTPGPIAIRLVAAYVPKGQAQYTAYTTTVLKATLNNNPSQVQASTDSGGVFTKNGEGDYTYTFKTKAPAGFDVTATHSIGIQASRDQSEFQLPSVGIDDVFNFVPDGSKPTVLRNVINTSTCNKCHNPISAHGGARQKVEYCILCHTPQSVNPDTLESADMPVMIHKIHMGKNLPSVVAGGKYRFWHRGAWSDFSEVGFPTEPSNCVVCHEGGTAQPNAWLKPSRAACGSCHDNVNFATGLNHVNMPQISDSMCANCHFPEGEMEYDTSIKGAHRNASFSKQLPGTTFQIVKVESTSAGQKPVVTFSVKNTKGEVIDASKMDSLSLVLAGPTSDYAYYKSESAKAATRVGDIYSYTFASAIPDGSKGTYTMAIEGYKNIIIDPGTTISQTVRDVGYNQMVNFSVDGSTIVPRRIVVSEDKCNACHSKLMLHGTIRRNIQYCVTCHNPNMTDASRRTKPELLPAESINFKTMIHKIHRGKAMTSDFTVYGYGNTPHNYNEVGFSGDLRDCNTCHVGTSYQVPLKDNLLDSVSPRDWIKPAMAPTTGACLSCHTAKPEAAHASMNVSPGLGEACAACHSPANNAAVDKVHAR